MVQIMQIAHHQHQLQVKRKRAFSVDYICYREITFFSLMHSTIIISKEKA